MRFFRQAPVTDTDLPLPAEENISLVGEALLSPEDVAERRQRRRRLVLLSASVALATGGWFGAKPAVHTLKAWQARRTAAEAEKLTAEHQWYAAKNKVQDALQLWRQEPAALRAAAVFLAATGNAGEAAVFWKQVEAARPLTPDEHRDDARALIGCGNFDAAETHLRKAWPAQQAGTPMDWDIGMQLARRHNNVPEMADLARRLLGSKESSVGQRLDGARSLLALSDLGARSEAWSEINRLAQGQSTPESLDALLLLARRAGVAVSTGSDPAGESAGSLPSLAELVPQIESHPLAKTPHQLLALDYRIEENPNDREKWIQVAMDRFAASNDDAVVVDLGWWLYGKKEFTCVLDVVPPERASNDHALLSLRLDALASLERWTEIREVIQSQKLSLDAMSQQIYLARCADKLGEPQVRDSRWQAALDEAAASPEKLMQLDRFAEMFGASAIAEKALRTAIQLAPELHQAYAALAQLLEAQGETEELRGVLASALKVWPQDPAVRNDAAYFDALLNENVPAALETARQLVRSEPLSLPHRITLALAQLRSGNALAALDACGNVHAIQEAMQPRQKAVYVAVLWALNYNHEAQAVLQTIALAQLLPEERALVSPINTQNVKQ